MGAPRGHLAGLAALSQRLAWQAWHIEWVYGEIVRKIAEAERVLIIIRGPQARARQVLAAPMPTWPMWNSFAPRRIAAGHATLGHLRAQARTKPEVAIAKFKFTAWAKYRNWHKDNLIAERIAQQRKMRLFPVTHKGQPVVLEGGGIDVNGCGTLLTTEECFLDQKTQCRNPGMSREEYDRVFADTLGTPNVIWLGHGIAGDDTHGHVDDLCRFVNPTTMVVIQEKNEHDVNFKPLRENWERLQDARLQDGARPEMIALPMPAPLFHGDWRLPASYANFYIANAAVIVPTFNDPADRIALGILGELFRDRPWWAFTLWIWCSASAPCTA